MRTNSSCTFDAHYARGKRTPSIQRNVHSRRPFDTFASPSLTARNPSGSFASAGSAHNADKHSELLADGSSAVMPPTDPPSRSSPEPIQTDLQGHYVGPASGISFLLRVQKRLHHSPLYSQASSTIFTFGDTPLPEYDSNFFVIQSKEETRLLLQKYFEFTVPVDRFLHRPTVEAWLEEFHDTFGAMRNQEDAPARRAVLFLIFALSQDLTSPKPSSATTDLRYTAQSSTFDFSNFAPVSITSLLLITSCPKNGVLFVSPVFRHAYASASGSFRSLVSITVGAYLERQRTSHLPLG